MSFIKRNGRTSFRSNRRYNTPKTYSSFSSNKSRPKGNTESLYYKYIASYLGYKPPLASGNLNPFSDHVFYNVGSKRDMLEQISLINEDIKYNFISDDTINIIGQSTLYGDLNDSDYFKRYF